MPQFIIKPEDITGNTFSIKGEEARHLISSLRIKKGEKIFLMEILPEGTTQRRYSAKVQSVSGDTVSGKISYELKRKTHQPGVRIFSSLIKPDRFEMMLEKLTEIGVEEITPVINERTVKGYSNPSPGRKNRWQKIIISAVKQCCCERIPRLKDTQDFNSALKSLSHSDLNLIACEPGPNRSYFSVKPLTEVLRVGWDTKSNPAVNLFFGPEGGFTEVEIALAKKYGFIPFSLGENVMRTETAAIVSAGAVIVHYLTRRKSPGRGDLKEKIVSVSRMRDLDKSAQDDYGIPSIVLMENAGKEIAIAVKNLCGIIPCRVAVFCGPGNNGGDGLVAARFLNNGENKANIFLLDSPDKFKGDALTNFLIVKKMRIPVFELNPQKFPDLSEFDVIIDALFGTGLRGDISGTPQKVIELINDCGKPVVSADIPSGLDGDTGQPLGTAVKATLTVTMEYVKKGLLSKSAREYVGRLIVADIGLPGYKRKW
ncbi:MAG: NAD(P)H-hydrate epimerase [Elusimicrobiota bacterium]